MATITLTSTTYAADLATGGEGFVSGDDIALNGQELVIDAALTVGSITGSGVVRAAHGNNGDGLGGEGGGGGTLTVNTAVNCTRIAGGNGGLGGEGGQVQGDAGGSLTIAGTGTITAGTLGGGSGGNGGNGDGVFDGSAGGDGGAVTVNASIASVTVATLGGGTHGTAGGEVGETPVTYGGPGGVAGALTMHKSVSPTATFSCHGYTQAAGTLTLAGTANITAGRLPASMVWDSTGTIADSDGALVLQGTAIQAHKKVRITGMGVNGISASGSPKVQFRSFAAIHGSYCVSAGATILMDTSLITMPDAADVRSGVAVDGETGTYTADGGGPRPGRRPMR